VQFACAAAGAPPAARLRAVARAAASGAAEVTLRIVGAGEARRLNVAYRAQSEATNVLAFRYRERTPRQPLWGDVVLCHPLVVREARAQGKTIEAHYAHLIVHGTLHLRGYDHQRARDAARMEKRETAILRLFGYADPYGAGLT